MMIFLATLLINLGELDTKGFTLVENVWTEDDLTHFRQGYQATKEDAFALIDQIPSRPRIFYENGKRNESRYWKTDGRLIMQAGEGRYDFFLGFEPYFFPDRMIHNPTLDALMDQLLVGEYTHNAGVVLAAPGGMDQYWHRDVNTLSNADTTGAKLVNLDDFYYTVLIPITVPMTLENGATEFMTGTHRLAAADFPAAPRERLVVPLGAALVFNGKISHRGRANDSPSERPVLYITYFKKWYDESYRSGID